MKISHHTTTLLIRFTGAVILFLCCGTTPGFAQITFVGTPGTAPPPPTLGPYTMTPFALDNVNPVNPYGPIIYNTTSVATPPLPCGGSIGFSPAQDHRRVGFSWGNWSHGYTGDVYYGNGLVQTITLPAGTGAFYFYAEPDQYGTFSIQATAQDGTASPIIPVLSDPNVGGASYFGFYTINGVPLTSITVTNLSGGSSVALGEFAIACTGNTNVIKGNAQNPGSLLVFPFYKHDAQNKVDTRLTITNLGTLPINVHFLFLDGATCQEFDQFVCFTPNASIEWKASQFDPQNKGYVIAYTTDNLGRPIAYNGLIGNAFVNDGEYVGNYGAASFASQLSPGAPIGLVATPGLAWMIPFDGISLEMAPMTFAVDIQSPVDTVNQKLVLAGLSGDVYAGNLSGTEQAGVGLAYNGHEAVRSFAPFLPDACFTEKVIDETTPKVSGQFKNLIPKGEVGTLRFSVGAAVGLLMTSNKNTFNGIRTLHKVQVVKSSLIIPLVIPDCQYWIPQP